jgi:hypothetical protein
MLTVFLIYKEIPGNVQSPSYKSERQTVEIFTNKALRNLPISMTEMPTGK